jgi:hypothetical protein
MLDLQGHAYAAVMTRILCGTVFGPFSLAVCCGTTGPPPWRRSCWSSPVVQLTSLRGGRAAAEIAPQNRHDCAPFSLHSRVPIARPAPLPRHSHACPQRTRVAWARAWRCGALQVAATMSGGEAPSRPHPCMTLTVPVCAVARVRDDHPPHHHLRIADRDAADTAHHGNLG